MPAGASDSTALFNRAHVRRQRDRAAPQAAEHFLKNRVIDTLADPGRIVLKPGEAWPQPLRPAGGIEIRFRCGHGETADAVPAALREAVLQIIQALAEGGPDTGLPPVAQSLLAPYRRLTL